MPFSFTYLAVSFTLVQSLTSSLRGSGGSYPTPNYCFSRLRFLQSNGLFCFGCTSEEFSLRHEEAFHHLMIGEGTGIVSSRFSWIMAGVGLAQTTGLRTGLRRTGPLGRLLGAVFPLSAFPVTAGAIAGHNVLLPQPQQIHYGSGHLLIRGLGIRLATGYGVEDRFAADQLSRC